ncbi:MAG: protoglobin domain-containing protein [Verrucomicrobiales bacterium]|nr:protoglobin domain-containing protein [Verrucomicrobiales bacterium]
MEKLKEECLPVLADAKLLVGYSAKDEDLLRSASEHLLPVSKEVAVVLYKAMMSHDGVKSILLDLDFSEDELVAKLDRWIKKLLSGDYSDEFWCWHWVMGLLKAQRDDLDAGCMILLFDRLRQELTQRSFELFDEKSASKVTLSLSKLISCVNFIVFKSYRLAYQAAIEAGGLKKSILNRMIRLEVKGQMEKVKAVKG